MVPEIQVPLGQCLATGALPPKCWALNVWQLSLQRTHMYTRHTNVPDIFRGYISAHTKVVTVQSCNRHHHIGMCTNMHDMML